MLLFDGQPVGAELVQVLDALQHAGRREPGIKRFEVRIRSKETFLRTTKLRGVTLGKVATWPRGQVYQMTFFLLFRIAEMFQLS